MGYDKYGHYTEKGQYEYVSIAQILKNQFDLNFAFGYGNITLEEFKELLPYLIPITKKYLKSKGIVDRSENQNDNSMLIDNKKGLEKIEKLLQKSEFNDWFIRCVLNYDKSKEKNLEDYGLSEEAALVLKIAGYSDPTKIYKNPDNLLKELYKICVRKQYLMREIIKKLKLENIIEEDANSNKHFRFSGVDMIPSGDPNGNEIITDSETGAYIATLVMGKVCEDENRNANAPVLFAIDDKGNVYSHEEFQNQQAEIVKNNRDQYKKIKNRRRSLENKKVLCEETVKEEMYHLLLWNIFLFVALFLVRRIIVTDLTLAKILIITYVSMVGTELLFIIPEYLEIIVPEYLEILKLNKKIENENEFLESMEHVPKLDTTYIAEQIENIYANNLEIGSISEAVKLLNPEIGRMLIEGKLIEGTKLLEAPKEPEVTAEIKADEQLENIIPDNQQLIARLEDLRKEIIEMSQQEEIGTPEHSHQKTLNRKQ